ncbi:multicopper oxidase family protein [Actinocorallia sp. API 0066]|uniref:multicopper oxidase family protein n=1 Tax=Actinocorallia sp. API 0066 TaxID=2896846 RepID=UPI001E61E061|nr:multicopper oxidase family protein [Actinocorallia sp. API 0066]MCD0448663.1 multicopper oxidase family protein [Actinocorallia sp. API 0066]
MTTFVWIVLDHAVALVCVAAWFAAGAAAALQRHRLLYGVLIGAVLVTVARAFTVVVLWGRGWWFVQEKVFLVLPLLYAAGLAATLVAGPALSVARRTPGRTLPAKAAISLFTAGYAALVGLVVTFSAGYPLRSGTVLIAVSSVCAAALLTGRVLSPSAAESGAAAPSGLARRGFVGAAVTLTGGIGIGLLFRSPERVVTGGGPARATGGAKDVSVADLRGPRAPATGGITRRYTLTAKTATVRLPSGGELDARTYDGTLPGPAIRATEGDLVEVSLRNTDIEDGVTLHWHGYDVPCGEDGAPGATQHAVRPGGEFVYRFRCDQVGTYWYHTHQSSHPGVRKGLYGTLVVRPREATEEGVDLVLPVHTFDGAVLIGDQDGRAVHPARPGTSVRLRLINTDSDPRWFTLCGTPFRVTAVDGRDLNRPGEVREVGLRLPAGGRYDVVFQMPDTSVALLLDHDTEHGVLLRPTGRTAEDPAVPDTAAWPELDLLHYGEPAARPFDPVAADRRFTLVLDRSVAMVDGRPAYAQTVNGRGHPSVPDQLVAEGDLVRFTVVNRSLETHPWHLHGHPVLVLSRDGTPASGSPLWVDTFDVRPGQIWEVAFRADNPGIWMNHCHNLPHQEQGMMLRLVYEGVSTPFGGSGHTH